LRAATVINIVAAMEILKQMQVRTTESNDTHARWPYAWAARSTRPTEWVVRCIWKRGTTVGWHNLAQFDEHVLSGVINQENERLIVGWLALHSTI
jgi:hypothetical protein